MNSLTSVNIVNLLNEYEFEFDNLPDNLKCVKCKSVLKDACQVPCGCTFCRACINNMENEDKCCPGDLELCRGSSVSIFATDYKANNVILRLVAKCAHKGCVDKLQLVNMKEHMMKCMKRIVECPYREFGCTQDALTAEQMNKHVQLEQYSHSEILIERIKTLTNTVKSLDQENKALEKQVKDLANQLQVAQQAPNAPK